MITGEPAPGPALATAAGPPPVTQICYILLCHKSPASVIAQVRMLTGAGDRVVIHVDLNAPKAMEPEVRAAFADDPRVAFARRVRCGWGEWSLVEASLNGLRAGVEAFPEATHFYLISGDCMPIKSAASIRARLAAEGRDHIEVNDYFDSGWIKVGLKEERLIYRHWFNERTRKWLFYAALTVQQKLGLRRPLPQGLRIMVGSQWWCLRRSTAEALLAFVSKRRSVMRFFRTTWIPDETFFQTLVHHLVPRAEIVPRPPTFLLFSDYGMPVNFHDDHYELLVGQDSFFARKLSPRAKALKARLTALYASDEVAQGSGSGGLKYFEYLATRGRVGQRYAPRFWEELARLGAQRSVLLVVCKKWHVAKRYAQALGSAAGMPAYGYIFNEADAWLPDMGGLGSTVEKRLRHRLAFLRVLSELSGGDRLAFCVDPASHEIFQELRGDGCDLRVLQIRCEFTDGYLRGHAERMGLGIDALAPDKQDELIVTLRENIRQEHRDLQRMGLPGLRAIDEHSDLQQVTEALRQVAGLDADAAFRAAHQGRFNQLGSAHVHL